MIPRIQQNFMKVSKFQLKLTHYRIMENLKDMELKIQSRDTNRTNC